MSSQPPFMFVFPLVVSWFLGFLTCFLVSSFIGFFPGFLASWAEAEKQTINGGWMLVYGFVSAYGFLVS